MYLVNFFNLYFLLYILKYSIKLESKRFIFSIVSKDGLGNRIAAVPGTFLLSLLSNRHFHSIKIIYIE